MSSREVTGEARAQHCAEARLPRADILRLLSNRAIVPAHAMLWQSDVAGTLA